VSPESALPENVASTLESIRVENHVLAYDRQRKQLILDCLPDGIIAMDTNDEVTYVNRVAATLLGIDRARTAGKAARSLLSNYGLALSEIERTGQTTLSTKEGSSTRSILLRRIPILGEGSQHAGALWFLRDITQQRAAEKAQAEFISQIAHELKAPLNTIVTYVDALADTEMLDEKERGNYFNHLSGEAQRMARLISNLLQLSRIELGNLSARFAFVKSSTLIQHVAESFVPQAVGRSQTLRIFVPENLPPLFGDKDLLSVAISNLLSNALKYTPDAGTIEVRAGVDGGEIRVDVTDTGIGIPKESLETVFERFSRSDQPEVRAVPGTGLGLALVREIVELHAGTITVESQLGRGSKFRVQLPVREVGERLEVAAA
jgi:PAS domain S-box-containing protein